MDNSKMLYKISPGENSRESVLNILEKHPEVEFVSFVGVDVWDSLPNPRVLCFRTSKPGCCGESLGSPEYQC